MKFALTFLSLFLASLVVYLCGIQLDLAWNPWLLQEIKDWRWYNYFFSHHAPAVLYAKGWLLWIIYPYASSLFATFLLLMYRSSSDETCLLTDSY